MRLNAYAKAVIAAIVAGYAMLEASVEPVIVDGVIVEAAGTVTKVEAIRIGGAVVAALGLVWGVPNVATDKVKRLKAKLATSAHKLPEVAGDGVPGESMEVSRDG